MCYCCRKLEILCILYVWEAEFGRPWEAVWGRGALIGLEICVRESQIFGANQSPTASHGLSRPLTICHVICLSQSGGARPLTRTASQISDSQICEAVGVRSDSTGRSNAFSREISQMGPEDDSIARCAWEADRTLKSVRPICEAVGVRRIWLISRLNALLRPVESDWTLTASQIGLTDLRVRSVRGRGRPSTASHTTKSCDLSESPKWEAELRGRMGGRESPIGLSRTAGDAVRSSGQSHLYRPKQCI